MQNITDNLSLGDKIQVALDNARRGFAEGCNVMEQTVEDFYLDDMLYPLFGDNWDDHLDSLRHDELVKTLLRDQIPVAWLIGPTLYLTVEHNDRIVAVMVRL